MFKKWFDENLAESAEDLATHGAVGGFPGITYYNDTCKLYDEFEDEIWEALYDDAQDFGYSNALELVGSFNGAKDVATDYQFKNLLVWYMCEREANQREIA